MQVSLDFQRSTPRVPKNLGTIRKFRTEKRLPAPRKQLQRLGGARAKTRAACASGRRRAIEFLGRLLWQKFPQPTVGMFSSDFNTLHCDKTHSPVRRNRRSFL